MRKFILILALVVTACAPIAVTQPIVPTPTRSPVSGSTPTSQSFQIATVGFHYPYRALRALSDRHADAAEQDALAPG